MRGFRGGGENRQKSVVRCLFLPGFGTFQLLALAAPTAAATPAAAPQDPATVVKEAAARATVIQGVGLDALENRIQAILERAPRVVAAGGRPVVPLEEMRASEGFKALQLTQTPPGQPYTKTTTGSPKHYIVMGTTQLPLWFGHFDPLGDVSPFSLDNWRSLNKMSVDLNAVVIIPSVTIDFAEVSSSGRSNFGSSAEVGAKPAMSLEASSTALQVFHAKVAIAGDGERAPFKRPLALASDYGQMRELKQSDNVGLTNALTALTGTQGTQRVSTQLAIEADPARYAENALRGTVTANAVFAEALKGKR